MAQTGVWCLGLGMGWFLLSGGVGAETPKDSGVEDISEEVSEATPAALGASEVLGRLHPALVHLPIGWLLLVSLFELGVAYFRKHEWNLVGRTLLAGTALVLVPAAITGWMRSWSMGTKTAVWALVVDHRNLMLAVSALVLLALLVRFFRPASAGLWRNLYLGILWVGCAVLGWGGHLGGKLVYGPNYLPF